MKLVRLGLGVLTSAIAASSFAQIAPHAQVSPSASISAVIPQTWVSGTGSDGNPCTRALPCATFAAALALTSPGGEVGALDAGDFGSATITKAVTISGSGGSITSGTGAAKAAILTVSAAATDSVTIRNLDLNGFGVAQSGIQVNTAKTVHIENVRITSFAGPGIYIVNSGPTSVSITDSTSSNSQYGVVVFGSSVTANVLISHCHFAENLYGVAGLAGAQITVSDSDVSRGNVSYEVVGNGPASSLNLIRAKAIGAILTGLQADNNGFIRFSESTLANNATAALANTGGSIISFGNNAVANALRITGTTPLQ